MTYDDPAAEWDMYCYEQDAKYNAEIQDMQCADCCNCSVSDGTRLWCTRYQDWIGEENTDCYCEKTMLSNCYDCPALMINNDRSCNAMCTWFGEFINSNDYVTEIYCEDFNRD